jgi:5-methylthioadenosine/S-adenosylhomocysteine deaminase
MRLRIKGAKVLTQDEKRRILDADVLVEDGAIARIGDVKERVDETIDAHGMWLMPGLVNAHTHLAMSLLRGYGDDLPLEEWLRSRIWPAEDRMKEEDIRAGTRLAALELIAGGTTTFNDMYFFEDAVADECAKAGLRGIAGWGMVDVGKVGPDEPNPRLPEIERFLAKWKDHPLVRGAPAPHAVYTCGSATYGRSAELAKKFDTLLHTHAHETRTEVYDVVKLKGVRPLTFLQAHGSLTDRTLLAHCGWVTKEEVRTIAAAGAGVAHCPVSNLKLATGGTMPLPELLAARAHVGLGTDGPASNNTLDLFETMKFTALVHKQARWDATVASAQTVLDLATRGGAAALRLGDRVGSIEVGKRADLVLVDPRSPRLTPVHDPVSHLVYAARAEDVHATIVDGKVLRLGDDYRTLQPERILADAQKAAERLTRPVERAAKA